METKGQHRGAVVEPIKIPKMNMKIAGDKAAGINAFAVSFAVFFGVLTIFAAIAGFTKGEWVFNIPLIGALFANVGDAGLVTTGLLAAAFGVIGLVTIGKITDARALSKAWNVVSKTFFVLAQVYIVSILGIAIYSLLAASKDSVEQGDLWLSGFLPNLITAGLAATMAFVAKKISDGKTAILRMLSVVGMGVASLGVLLVIIQTLVVFYANSTPSGIKDILDLYR